MIRRRLLAGAVALVALAGCAPSPSAPLVGRTFVAQTITENSQPKQLVAGTQITISFTGDQIGAQAGCNHIGGKVDASGGRLRVPQLGSTLIGCREDENAQDQWLAAFIQAEPAWRLDGDTLTLTTSTTVMQLKAA